MHADKLERFLQVDTNILDVFSLTRFCACVKILVSQLLLFSIVMQNIQIFYGGPVMFVVTFLILYLIKSLLLNGNVECDKLFDFGEYMIL